MKLSKMLKISPAVRAAVFDFDGTVSLLSEGWQELMQALFESILFERVSFTESEAETERKKIAQFIFELTGKPSFFQCARFVEEVALCGGPKLDAKRVHAEFLSLIDRRLEEREEAIRSGEVPAETFLVPGVRPFLERLQAMGWRLMLVSGSVDAMVQRQCCLLRLHDFFDGGVFGSPTNTSQSFSKEAVIRDFMARFGLKPAEIVGFGDGFVETHFVHAIGGFAVGLATREKERDGKINEWKREKLLEASADAILPDFSTAMKLL